MFKLTLKLATFLFLFWVTDYLVAGYLCAGLAKHYGFDNEAKILCIGHSRSEHGIDKNRIEQALNVPVAKYAIAGMDAFDRYAMLQHYFSEHPQKPKMVVYDIDFFTFNGRTVSQGQNSQPYRQLYPFMDNPEINNYLYARGTWSEYWSRKCLRSLRYNDPKVFARAIINHFKSPEMFIGKFDAQKYLAETSGSRSRYDSLVIDQNAVDCFKKTMEFIRSKDVKIVLVFFPIVDIESDLIDFNYRNKVLDIVRDCAAKDKGIFFSESNKKYAKSRELFYDPLHFNRTGQILATDELIDALKQNI